MNYGKINQNFLAEYLELDKTFCEKLGTHSGISEYINKLSSAKYAPGRDETLPRLIKYRGMRNRIAHEPGALKDLKTISKDDVAWIKNFRSQVKRGKDPFAIYLKRASDKANGKALKRALIIAAAAAVVIGIAVLVLVLI